MALDWRPLSHRLALLAPRCTNQMRRARSVIHCFNLNIQCLMSQGDDSVSVSAVHKTTLRVPLARASGAFNGFLSSTHLTCCVCSIVDGLPAGTTISLQLRQRMAALDKKEMDEGIAAKVVPQSSEVTLFAFTSADNSCDSRAFCSRILNFNCPWL